MVVQRATGTAAPSGRSGPVPPPSLSSSISHGISYAVSSQITRCNAVPCRSRCSLSQPTSGRCRCDQWRTAR